MSNTIQQQLDFLIEQSADGIVIADERSNIVNLNKTLTEVLEYNSTDLIGSNLSKILQHPQNPDNPLDLAVISQNTPPPITIAALVIKKNGQFIKASIAISQYTIESAIYFMVNINHQYTCNNKYYKALFNQGDFGIIEYDKNGIITDCNSRFLSLINCVNYLPNTLNITDLTHPEDRLKEEKSLKSCLAENNLYFTIEKRYVQADKSSIWIRQTCCPILDDNNIPTSFIAIANANEWLVFEKNLKNPQANKEELLRGLYLATKVGGIGMWYWNMLDNTIEWDLGMYELYGIDPKKEVTYSDWADAIDRSERKEIEAGLLKKIDDKEPWEATFKITRVADKEDRWIKAAANIMVKDNKPVVMFGINQDISTEKKAQISLNEEIKNATEANAAKSRFLAMMSHEIRTPMNGIIGMIDLINDTSLTSDQHEMTEIIGHSATSLLSVINDILDFSKIESGKMSIEQISTSVLDIIEKSIDTIFINVREKKKSIYVNVDLNIPKRILIDPIRLRQIILNLVGNAVKFTKNETGKIFIDTKFIPATFQQTLNFVSISIRDNGIGMTKEHLEKLFQPFSQADESTTRRFGGTGLGLSITKSFIDMMGGTIQVESEPGVGSTFTINIPAHNLPYDTFSYQDVSLDNGKVFIITDDQCDATVLSNLYSQLNARVITSQNIEEITDTVDKENISLIIISDEKYTTGEFNEIIDLYNTRTIVVEKSYQLKQPSKSNSDNTVYINGYPISASKFISKSAKLLNLDIAPDSDIYKNINKGENSLLIGKSEIGHNHKILIAEDQEINREVITLQMEKIGVDFDMRKDGVEAYAAWIENKYSLILTDCNMPNMDGFELAKKIRETEKQNNITNPIPIIAITANALTGDKDICLKAGMNDYLSKPLSITKLKDSIVHWSQTNQTQDTDAESIDNDNSHSESTNTEITDNESTDSESTDNNQPDMPPVDKPQPTDAVTEAPAPIDFNAIHEIIGMDDKDVIYPLLESYIDSLSKSIKKIAECYKQKDIDGLRSASHSAKGAANSVGAHILGDIFDCIQIEAKKLEQADLLKIREHIKDLINNTKILKLYLVDLGVI